MLCEGRPLRTGLVDMDVPWTFYRTGQSMHFRVITPIGKRKPLPASLRREARRQLARRSLPALAELVLLDLPSADHRFNRRSAGGAPHRALTIAGMVPGVERQPLKKLEPDPSALLQVIERWRNEAIKANRPIGRVVLAYEAGRDGFLAGTVVAVARCGSACDPLYKRRGLT